MKRDNELIRDLLFRYEAESDWLLFTPGETLGSSQDEWKERYHVYLMIDEGLLLEVGQGTMRLTAQGHDFLDAIRNDTVWNKTKDGIAKIGGATLAMVRELAVAYVKEEAAKRLGIQL